MKRRNADLGKMRRPIKRNKITEGIYGSTLLYMKFLLLWALVILADFILEFRFEFLWPFYLLLRSVYDSFRYQGLAFSVFFVCIALTSDLICFFFIPVHWLFFAASTYVWVQYVWHTDKGICLPTVILWMLFVYLEAAIRLKDVRHMPFHMDLCRPFAAHCIGYPVVTLGFGFKSYIGYRMRQRRQREVAKENEFYMQLLQQALPPPTTSNNQSSNYQTDLLSGYGPATVCTTTNKSSHEKQTKQIERNSSNNNNNSNSNSSSNINSNGHIMTNGVVFMNGRAHRSKSNKNECNSTTNTTSHSNSISVTSHEHQQHQQTNSDNSNNNNNSVLEHVKRCNVANGAAITPGSGTTTTPPTVTVIEEQTQVQEPQSSNININRRKDRHCNNNRDQSSTNDVSDCLQRLESDVKRLRADLQNSRTNEQELRNQLTALTASERNARTELSSVQKELEEVQARLQSTSIARANERQTLSGLERRLTEERRLRMQLEAQLAQERKSRKQEEAAAAAAVVRQQQQQRVECTESCRMRRRDLEAELQEARNAVRWNEERYAVTERELAVLVEQQHDKDILMSALNAMQDKNQHLENSLSAETRIKLDLFSALGEAKRLLEIRDSIIRSHEKEIDELKSKIAQVLAVMPSDSFDGPPPSSSMSRVRLTESPLPLTPPSPTLVTVSPGSTLDPNATAYTPKSSLTSTEA